MDTSLSGSCLGQADIKTGVVVLDNNSTDGTVEIVKKFPVQIYTYNGVLPGKCLNYGISKCLGKYIVFLSGHL